MTLFNTADNGRDWFNKTDRRLERGERRGSMAPAPFFRLARSSSFTWPGTAAGIPWDTTIEGATDALTFDTATRLFTCNMAGVWQLEAQSAAAPLAAASKSAIKLFWMKNGTAMNGNVGFTDASFATTIYSSITTELDDGDTIGPQYAATPSSPAGQVVDGSRSLCFFIARYVGSPTGEL